MSNLVQHFVTLIEQRKWSVIVLEFISFDLQISLNKTFNSFQTNDAEKKDCDVLVSLRHGH